MNGDDCMDWAENRSDQPAEDLVVKKLNSVLEKILQPNFKTQDDTVLDKLFDLIVMKWPAKDASPPVASSRPSPTTSQTPPDATLDTFPSWLATVVIGWAVTVPEVRVFALRLAGHVASTERGFHALSNNGVANNLVALARSTRLSDESGTTSHNKFSVTLSFVELVKSLSSHSVGMQFILKQDLWRDVLGIALSSRSIYALKSAWTCASSIAFFLMKSNSELCKNIITSAFSLKFSNGVCLAYGQLDNPMPFGETSSLKSSWDRDVETSLNAVKLAYTLVTSLLDRGIDQRDLLSLFEKSQLDKWIWTELHHGQNIELLRAASKLNCLYNILHIEHFQPGFTSDLKARLMTKLVSQHSYLLVHRHLFDLVLDMCVEYQELWKSYGGEIIQSEERDKKNFKCSSNECSEDFNYSVVDGEFRVQNCLLVIQAMPMFLAIKDFSTSNVELDTFIDKIFHMTSPKVVRLGYFFRDKMVLANRDVRLKIAHRSILQFIRLTEIGLRKPQAVSIFQTLSYVLKFYAQPPEKKEGAGYDLLIKHPDILSATMHCLSCLIKQFVFSPIDCFEATCLLATLQELLINPLLSPSLCVDTLKLIELVLLKFIPPNLALLVNTLQGSSISELGKQLYKTLLKVNWEVQDSALEVIQVISKLAATEFPPFELLLLQNDLASLVLIKAENEHEPYVRASSLICLKEMVPIDAVWNGSLINLNLLEKMLLIMHYETEGIVRNQAALLIEAMFRYNRIPETSHDSVFDTMQLVAQSDLHWEVKQSALTFWDTVIKEQFKLEGMIDGHFPDVVFSKEKKKIVRMTPTETSTRVFNAFNKLSSNGCLHVLWDSFHNECDLQVQKTSVEIIKNLIDTANKFHLVENVCNIPRLTEVEYSSAPKAKCPTFIPTVNVSFKHQLEPTVRNETTKPTDDVIDGIVAQGDSDLLRYIALDGEPPPRALPKISRSRFSPLEFIAKFSSIDFEKFLRTKRDWMNETSEGFESLLNDVLVYCDRVLPTNVIDCY